MRAKRQGNGALYLGQHNFAKEVFGFDLCSKALYIFSLESNTVACKSNYV